MLVVCVENLYTFIISFKFLTFSFNKIETIHKSNDQLEPSAGKHVFIMPVFCGSLSKFKEQFGTHYVFAAFKYFGCSSSLSTGIALSLCLYCNLFRAMMVSPYFMYKVPAYHP